MKVCCIGYGFEVECDSQTKIINILVSKTRQKRDKSKFAIKFVGIIVTIIFM